MILILSSSKSSEEILEKDSELVSLGDQLYDFYAEHAFYKVGDNYFIISP